MLPYRYASFCDFSTRQCLRKTSHINCRRVSDQARARQIRILTPTRWKERAGIVAIAVNGDADEIEAKLKTQGVRIAAKDGHLRAGVHFYNNHEDIDRLIAGLAAA